MKALQLAMEPQDVVERLESVLAELEGRLPLPAGAVGAGLLDALETADRIRRVVRAEAKTLLRERELRVVIRSHHRRSAMRLVQRPRILK